MTEREISVLQWNVWYQEPIGNILDAITTMPGGVPSVICLQELTNGYSGQANLNTWQHIADSLNYNCYVDEIEVTTDHAVWLQAVAIFSLYKITSQSKTKLHVRDPARSPYDQSRSYVEATLATPSGDFTAATAHLDVGDPHALTAAKQQEIGTLEQKVRGRQRYGFFADINAGMGSAAVQMLDRHVINAGPPMDQPSWPTLPQEPDKNGEVLPQRLDVACYSADIEVVSSQFVESAFSDHKPILSVARLPAA